MEITFTAYKKYTTNGLVRRGRPGQGGPLERFNHSLFLSIGKLLSTTPD